jgi:hypothetical protein
MLVVLLMTAPWVAGIAWYWRRLPRDGALPMSMADHARRRFPAG